MVPKKWDIVRKLLGWMVCAKRPLKWREIQAAVSLNSVVNNPCKISPHQRPGFGTKAKTSLNSIDLEPTCEYSGSLEQKLIYNILINALMIEETVFNTPKSTSNSSNKTIDHTKRLV